MRQARRLRGPRLRTKRAYEAAARSDGYRVLVDRLWPRGVKKDALALDAWAKDLAPSSELRRWFGHAPSRWKKFVERYRWSSGLRQLANGWTTSRGGRRRALVTVVYGARSSSTMTPRWSAARSRGVSGGAPCDPPGMAPRELGPPVSGDAGST